MLTQRQAAQGYSFLRGGWYMDFNSAKGVGASSGVAPAGPAAAAAPGVRPGVTLGEATSPGPPGVT